VTIQAKKTNVRFAGLSPRLVTTTIGLATQSAPLLRTSEFQTMPKLKPETQAARRAHILDAAERCFVRTGFHRTTMQDICREAGVSLGAFYVYFGSKEALIQGISERERAQFCEDFSALSSAPDFLHALSGMGEKIFVARPREKQRMCVEIGIEATRNPHVAKLHAEVESLVLTSFKDLFHRLQMEGRVAPGVDTDALALAFVLIGDGLFWRRAVHADFDIRAVLPILTHMLAAAMQSKPSSGHVINPHLSIPHTQSSIEIAS
jgi:TetR/AcrR family transcriptional regulator, repressor for uid operon